MGGAPMPTPATMRPVVRFSAVGQVNVHPLLVGGLASIWCRVRGTLGYSCLPGCLPMAFSLDTGMVTTMVTRKTAFFRVAYLALTHPQTKPHKPCCVSESTSGSGHQTLLQRLFHHRLLHRPQSGPPCAFSGAGHSPIGERQPLQCKVSALFTTKVSLSPLAGHGNFPDTQKAENPANRASICWWAGVSS